MRPSQPSCPRTVSKLTSTGTVRPLGRGTAMAPLSSATARTLSPATRTVRTRASFGSVTRKNCFSSLATDHTARVTRWPFSSTEVSIQAWAAEAFSVSTV